MSAAAPTNTSPSSVVPQQLARRREEERRARPGTLQRGTAKEMNTIAPKAWKVDSASDAGTIKRRAATQGKNAAALVSVG
jgi:hypothetical protein